MPSQTHPQTQAGRPRNDHLDAAIHQATLTLLAQVGYTRITIAEVARRASTVPPTVYRRYPSVKKLVLATLRTELATLAGGTPDLGSLRDDLIAYVRAIGKVLNPQRTAILAGLLVPMHHDSDLAEVMRAGLGMENISSWGAIIDRAIHRGELGPKTQTLGALSRVAPSVVFERMAVLHFSVDDAFIAELVDTVLLPALSRHLPDAKPNFAVNPRST